MRYLYLAVGLLFIVGGGVLIFVRPAVPSTTDLLAYQFILSGFILLGISHIVKLLQTRAGV